MMTTHDAVVWARIDLSNVPGTALQDLEDAMEGWNESGQLQELAEWLENAECFQVFRSPDYDPDDEEVPSYNGGVFIDASNDWAMIRTHSKKHFVFSLGQALLDCVYHGHMAEDWPLSSEVTQELWSALDKLLRAPSPEGRTQEGE